jgi:hypothetical protein
MAAGDHICSRDPVETPAELGDDLAALVRGVGSALVAATPLSRPRAGGAATAFRLRFADGSELKGCRVDDPGSARLVPALAARLGTLAPRIVASRGHAMLTEWIAGTSLAAAEWSDAVLQRCGAAQARAHRETMPGGDSRQRLSYWRDRMRRGLETLAAATLLDADEQRRLLALGERHAPAAAAVGISLGDYCHENIVCRGDGEPCLIDLETLAIAPNDYDLGRTWYRWPMTAAQRAVYLEGYRRHRDPAPFLAHLPFWRLVALTEGAVYRHGQRRDDLGEPLAGLRALLTGAP